VQVVELDVDLPDGAGRIHQQFRISGIVGFVVAKVGALVGRDKPKDAYDIVWLLEAWSGGPEGAAASVRDSPLYERADVQTALQRLALEFADIGRVGPRSYAQFVASRGATADDRDRLARQAVGAVSEFTKALRRSPESSSTTD
jgi:hypothetical protein